MKEYFDCLILTHGTAFGVGAAIFLLTILLVAKRVVGFFLSVILLLIALGASWAINNETIVRSYLDKWIPSTQSSSASRPSAASTQDQAPADETNATQAQQQAQPQVQTQAQQDMKTDATTSGSDNLKGSADAQRSRVKEFLNETHPNINPQQ